MKDLLTFTPYVQGKSIYRVHDALSGLVTIGLVRKIGRSWVATPNGVGPDETGKRFGTRYAAAYALSRYGDTVRDGCPDPRWIVATPASVIPNHAYPKGRV